MVGLLKVETLLATGIVSISDVLNVHRNHTPFFKLTLFSRVLAVGPYLLKLFSMVVYLRNLWHSSSRVLSCDTPYLMSICHLAISSLSIVSHLLSWESFLVLPLLFQSRSSHLKRKFFHFPPACVQVPPKIKETLLQASLHVSKSCCSSLTF